MDNWVNPDSESICDICRLPEYQPAERPAGDWNEVTGNHITCEAFVSRDER